MKYHIHLDIFKELRIICSFSHAYTRVQRIWIYVTIHIFILVFIKLYKMADNAVFILDVSYESFSTFQILRDIHSVFIAAD